MINKLIFLILIISIIMAINFWNNARSSKGRFVKGEAILTGEQISPLNLNLTSQNIEINIDGNKQFYQDFEGNIEGESVLLKAKKIKEISLISWYTCSFRNLEIDSIVNQNPFQIPIPIQFENSSINSMELDVTIPILADDLTEFETLTLTDKLQSKSDYGLVPIVTNLIIDFERDALIDFSLQANGKNLRYIGFNTEISVGYYDSTEERALELINKLPAIPVGEPAGKIYLESNPTYLTPTNEAVDAACIAKNWTIFHLV